jgi:hypothetical protein
LESGLHILELIRGIYDTDGTITAADLNACKVAWQTPADAVADTVVQLAGAAQYQTLKTLAEAVAIGLLEQFAAVDTIAVAVSKFSPPVAHILERLGVRLSWNATKI